MAHSEILSKELIRNYVDALVQSFGYKKPVPEKALLILFNEKLFGECIREVKKMMSITCKLKVYSYGDESFPFKGLAAIDLPKPIPLYGSRQFENLYLTLYLRKSLRDNYHTFVYTIAHEMSHIVLFSTRHSLLESEVATDLFVMICGFENIMATGRSGCGYLDDKHFLYAQKYLQKVRKGEKGQTLFKKIEEFIKKFKKAPS